jgi:SAM-dependent methyltransferase
VGGVFRVDEDAYDDFMGRYSVRLARVFADFAGVSAGERVLDVGAGTGALTRELVARGAHVVASEPSPEFAKALRGRFAGMEVHEGPAEELPFDADSFDLGVAQLVVAFMTDAPAAMRRLGRIARRVAICMWGVQEMQLFAAIDATGRAIGHGAAEQGARRYRTAQELRDLLADAGFARVETGELDVSAPYTGFDELWRTLGRQVGPAGAWVAGMDDDQRRRARDELFRQVGRPSGAFELHGRAFAVRAHRD